MSFCRGCGHQIHETAESCPQCGAVVAHKTMREQQEGTLWLPVPSLLCGIVVVLALFDQSKWGMDQVVGRIAFAAVPDGQSKFPHLWPPQIPQARPVGL